MKILFLSQGAGVDYMCDSVFHGLRSLYGTDVVDANRLWYLYNSISAEEKARQYGRGFTMCGLIEEGEVDRSDLLGKIKSHFFDLVVYGSIHRNADLLYDVLGSYSREEVIFIDGEDQPMFLREFPAKGLYFKRELHSPQDYVHSIQFGIPEEKIVGPLPKTKMVSYIDPMNLQTYIYDKEEDYYRDYRESLFGRTCRKAGWDCMRHYEILASGCLPIFENLEHCPPTIMTELPKGDLLVAKVVVDYYRHGGGIDIFSKPAGRELWQDIMDRCMETLKTKLTTKAIAKRVVEVSIQASLHPRGVVAYA